MRTCKKCGQPNDGTHYSWCRSCFNAYQRGRYARDPEAEVARCSAWNKANPDRVAANMRTARARQPEHFREATRRWRRENPQRASVHDANKRAKRREATVGDPGVTPEQWAAIKARFEHCCAYCFRPGRLTMDHMLPIARGGRHEPENIAPACLPCNSAKQARTPSEFLARVLA